MLDAHVIKRRAEFTVDARIRLAAGERLALFGASGAGKSTILSCIAGLETPDGGEIHCAGATLFPPPRPLHMRRFAYLAQQDLLFPHLTVAQNVMFGVADRNGRTPVRWIDELRERLGLDAVWNVSARAVSGGQARRVALARMLAREPQLVLLDEPFTALDRPLIADLVGALDEWQRRLKFALIVVDHRPELLARLCARAAVIERGRIVQEGRWSALAAAPATVLTARLLGDD
jgi:molybdate transport system ATP-binding protein